jgi:CbiX
VTDQSPDAEQPPRWEPPTGPDPLPRRKPPGDDARLGPSGGSLFERPERLESQPQRDAEPLPQHGGALPQRGGAEPLPQRGAPEPLPQRGAPEPLPQRGGAEPLPQRGGEPMPQRNGSLPRRTGRTRAGRHRSPHRLSVASDAPALVLAVPGSATGAHVQVVEEIAAVVETSCPGVEIRVGFLDGDAHRLADNLAFDQEPGGERPLDGVIVPLLAGPHPEVDAALARAAEQAAGQVMVGAHLGPHPLIAEALHTRLAEAGLARGTRSRGLSIATSTYGVVVLADRGDEAIKTAGVAAVLLASRLAMPAAPASIDDPASIEAALARLREAGAERPVIAPCLIGPETPQRELDVISAALGAPCSAPLGAHAAVGQLVAIRYGAALARLSMVG